MQSNSGGMTLYSLGTKFNLSHAITLFICNLIQGAKLIMVQATMQLYPGEGIDFSSVIQNNSILFVKGVWDLFSEILLC